MKTTRPASNFREGHWSYCLLLMTACSMNLTGRPGPCGGSSRAVRTTGLLTAGRNRRTERTPSPNCWRPTATTLFSKGSYPRPLDCGLGPLPGRVFFAIGAPTGHSTAAVTGGVQPGARRETGRVIDSTAAGAEAGNPLTSAKVFGRAVQPRPATTGSGSR